jgi:transposase-like protein
VRLSGAVISTAVLNAIGIDARGRRSVLGVSVSLSEAEVHWREFLASLQERGLHGVQLIVSDSHAGLKAACAACFAGVPWQRCQLHLMQNALHQVPRQHQKAAVAQELRAVFHAPHRNQAQLWLEALVREWEQSAPRLAHWLEGTCRRDWQF